MSSLADDDPRVTAGGYTLPRGPAGWKVRTFTLLLGLSLSAGAPLDAAVPSSRARGKDRHLDSATIQDVVNDYRARLSLPQEVRVTIVPINPLVVSVEPLQGRDGPYLLSLQGDFLDGLTDDELRAVIAHELGHVWIFTHHPYLQTEALANEVAMRLVSRETLERVYEKVWARTGKRGTPARFQGDR